MLAPTHSIFGICLTLTTLAVFGIKYSLHWTIIAFAILGSLMPDIDMPRSFIGRIFFFISKPIERKFGHRTVTHSLIGWLAATVLTFGIITILYLIFQKNPVLSIPLCKRWLAAFAIGYLSHLILDMLNPRGSQLFWPDKGRDVIPKNPKFRPKAGSKIEIVIFLFLFGFMLLSLPISKYGIGSTLRWLLATPESAIAEFRDMKTRMYVEFTGDFKATKERVTGVAEVLDVKNKKMIVYLASLNNEAEPHYLKKIYTLSDEFSADIMARKVRFKKTDQALKLDHKKFNNETRENLLALLPDTVLVSGTIYLPKGLDIAFPKGKDNISSFKTLKQEGDKLILKFATKKEIAALSLSEAFKLKNQKDQTEISKLTYEYMNTHTEISHLQDTDDLTELGRDLLLTDQEKQAQKQKLLQLENKLNQLTIQLKEVQLRIKERHFVFSGEVIIRHCYTISDKQN
jgi:membrane-bound metal-dependent hydrolase YbcI (DUF457 family)